MSFFDDSVPASRSIGQKLGEPGSIYRTPPPPDENENWFLRDIADPIGRGAEGLFDDGKDIIKAVHQDIRDGATGYTNTVQSIWTHGEDGIGDIGKSLTLPLAIGGVVLVLILLRK